MDLSILKKKISSYRTPKGSLTKVPDELAMEILHEWEQWNGPAIGFYQAIGITNPKKMAGLIGRAKKLKRDGMDYPQFKEIQIEPDSGQIRVCGFLKNGGDGAKAFERLAWAFSKKTIPFSIWRTLWRICCFTYEINIH